MKPRNFTVNLLLTLVFIAQIVLSLLTPNWQFIFFGIAGLILLIPEWILNVKHKAVYLSFKGVFQVLILVLGVGLFLYGLILSIAFSLSESLAQGCGGTVSHSEFDKFVAEYYMFTIIPIIAKVIMNIVDFALYKKERRQLIEAKMSLTSAE